MKFRLALCTLIAAVLAVDVQADTWLIIREAGPDLAMVEQQIFVNNDFLRMDIIGDDSGFLLFDRKKQLIHNVNLEDGTDLLIARDKIRLAPPEPFVNEVVKLESDELPAIDRHALIRYQIKTNQTVCHDIVAVQGALQQARVALTEYATALSSEQAVGLSVTPKEYVSECELASRVFEPGRRYAQGFPVRELDWRRRLRELVDYDENYVVDSGLLSVPEGLRVITMQEMRGEETQPSPK